MNITPTKLLTTGANVIITIVVGMFMVLNLAVITFYTLDGVSNYRKMQAANITHTVQLHTFLSDEFETNPIGIQRYCVALTDGRKVSIRELPNSSGIVPAGNFCQRMMNNATSWKSHVPAHESHFIENMFWSIVFFLIFMTGAYLVATIPASMIGIVVPFLLPYTRILALVLTLPVLVFWAVFVSSAWTHTPSYWLYNGYVVNTTKVFMNDNGQMFIAPNTLFEWSNSDTMSEITIKGK